jgi:hypothetical protein
VPVLLCNQKLYWFGTMAMTGAAPPTGFTQGIAAVDPSDQINNNTYDNAASFYLACSNVNGMSI